MPWVSVQQIPSCTTRWFDVSSVGRYELIELMQVPDRVLADDTRHFAMVPESETEDDYLAVDIRFFCASFAENNLHPAITAITDCLRQNPSYANSSFTTSPCTSVSRKSRPWKRYVSFV